MKENKLTVKQKTWNLKLLFASDNDPNLAKNRKKVEENINAFCKKWNEREDYLTDAKVLKQALEEYEHLTKHYGTEGDEGYYFWLRTMQDQVDPILKAKFAKVVDFVNTMTNNLQFFELRLAHTTKEKQKEFINSKELAPYKHYLENIFAQAKYVLSDAEEKILNLKADPAHLKWEQLLSGLLSKEERVVLTGKGKKEKQQFEQLLTLSTSTEKKVRDSAAAAVNEIFAKLTEVAEAEINAIFANKKIDDGLRGMERPDSARLLNDDVDPHFVDTLRQTVNSRNKLAHDFYKLKAQLLGVKKLAYHERNVEMDSVEKTYTFADATKIVHKVFQNLDPEFATIFESFLANGQIDIYPHVGKRGGACCTHLLLTQPTYILLNYNDKQRDVETLAHEMGHGINNELMKQKQHALNNGVPMVTAEVASTFMEDFVLQELLQDADDETRFSILMSKLNSDVSTIFRQIACYEFEMSLHTTAREKGYLSHIEIGKLFQKHMSAYMGPSVEQSPGSENWWVYWKHIRMFFYVYSYASGLLISKSMQNSVKQDPAFIKKVKNFLSAGTSASPKEIFAEMGIDITSKDFWNKGLDEIEALLTETKTLAKKLGKI